MPVAAGIQYDLHGPDDGPTVLLSSGLGGSASYWAPNLAALSEKHRVITYDHRGTGRSDRALPANVTVDDFADDMLAVLDATGTAQANIVGHAAGGVAALALARKASDRVNKIVVINGWSKPDPHFLRCFEARLTLLRKAGPEAFLRAQPIFLYPANWISENSAKLDAELPHQLADFSGAENIEKRVAALAAFDIDDRVGQISAHTLVVIATDDILVPPRAGDWLAAGLTNGSVLEFPSGGHACNVVDAHRFNTVIPAWLAGGPPKEK